MSAPDNDGFGYSTEPKVGRIMFHYSDKALLQSRLYPDSDTGNSPKVDAIRAEVQQIIAECEKLKPTNAWVRVNEMDKWLRAISEPNGAAHYIDYESSNNYPNYSYHKSICVDGEPPIDKYKLPRIVIGSAQFCLNTGKNFENSGEFTIHGGSKCEDCGNSYTIDDMYYIDGEYYCSDCTNSCNCCGGVVHEELYHISPINGRWGEYVCQSCYEDNYFYCNDCHLYRANNSSRELANGNVVCERCVEEYSTCQDCGDLFERDELEDGDDEELYCCECIGSHKEDKEGG
jgi:hypothetical protein